jgi:hypothetical protein
MEVRVKKKTAEKKQSQVMSQKRLTVIQCWMKKCNSSYGQNLLDEKTQPILWTELMHLWVLVFIQAHGHSEPPATSTASTGSPLLLSCG